MNTSIDLTPLVRELMPYISVILMAILSWLAYVIKNWVGSKIDLSKTQLDDQLQQMFNEAALRSIAYAETMIEGAVPKTVDGKSVFIKTAADYVILHWPDLVKKTGLTPMKIEQAIAARLPSGKMTEKADAVVLAKAGTIQTQEEKK